MRATWLRSSMRCGGANPTRRSRRSSVGPCGPWRRSGRARPGRGCARTRAVSAALARGGSALAVLEEACAGLARAAAQAGLGERHYTRAEWAQLLASALAEASLPPGGARGGAVQLVELRELWGRSLEHV